MYCHLAVRAWMEYKSIREEGKEFPYRWPLYFLTASSVWNFVGAGMFGFLINLPIINYYEHATYLTANHAHTALFGVYGMLAIALILFSWRGLVENKYRIRKGVRYLFGYLGSFRGRPLGRSFDSRQSRRAVTWLHFAQTETNRHHPTTSRLPSLP